MRSASSLEAQLTVAEQPPSAGGRALVQVEIRGTLRDDLGMGLPGAEVDLSLVPERGTVVARRTITDVGGHFRASVAVSPGPARLQASFAGDDLHAGASHARQLDLGKADVSLHLGGPRQIAATSRQLRLEIAAHSDEGSVGLPIVVSDVAGRVLARGTTDRGGRWATEVPVATIGRPGTHEITATFAGDARRNSASSLLRVVIRAPSFVSLHASPSTVAPGDTAELTGLLADHEGPIAGAAVGVFAGPRHLATATTDRAGVFSTSFALDDDERGALRLVARYVPDVAWREPAESPEALLRVITPRPVPVGWIVASVAGTLVLLGAAQLLRRVGRKEIAASGARAPAPPPAPGVSFARPSRGRAAVTSIGGHVRDVDEAGGPIAGATVRVARGDEVVIEALTDASGGFAIAELPAGRLAVSFVADGFVPQQSVVQLPHRGEWSRTQVRLESHRRRVERLFRATMVPAFVSAERYATATAREVARDAQAKRGAPPSVERLAVLAEEAAYGPEPPGEVEVARARDAVSQVVGAPRPRSR